MFMKKNEKANGRFWVRLLAAVMAIIMTVTMLPAGGLGKVEAADIYTVMVEYEFNKVDVIVKGNKKSEIIEYGRNENWKRKVITVEKGTRLTLETTAKSGYQFEYWSVQGACYSVRTTYQFQVFEDYNDTGLDRLFRCIVSEVNATTKYSAEIGDISMATVTKGYRADDCEVTVKVSNTGDGLLGYDYKSVSFEGDAKDCFNLRLNQEAYCFWGNSSLDYLIYLKPKEGLPAKTYKATLVLKDSKDKCVAKKSFQFVVSDAPTLKLGVASYDGTGTVKGKEGIYKKGDTITVEAIPAEGYSFMYWLDYNSEVSRDRKYTFKIDKAMYLKAYFEEKKIYQINVICDPNKGTVSGGGEVENGSSMTIKATPKDGYKFSNWECNGGYENDQATYKFYPYQNATYEAIFVEKKDPVSIENAEVTNIPASATWSGTYIEPVPSVKVGNVILDMGKDFIVSYENNLDVGTATVIIEGIGEYTGTIKKTFKITKADDDYIPTQTTSEEPTDKTTEKSTEKSTDKTAASKTVKGVGTFSADGKTLTDTDGKKYNVAEKLTAKKLKKKTMVADKKSAGKYKITKVTKKNGKVVLFDDEKVVRSILKANAEVPGEAMMRKTAQRYANEVFDRLTEQSEIITTDDVRRCVVEVLREKGRPQTAEHYLGFKK